MSEKKVPFTVWVNKETKEKFQRSCYYVRCSMNRALSKCMQEYSTREKLYNLMEEETNE